jgi:predicted ATP-grasp superfamily ATP-dependent carboligase
MRALPPVVVLGVDTPIGLAVIRDLGRRGVPVHAVGRQRHSIGLASRYVTGRHQAPPERERMLPWLQALLRDTGAPFIMAISESDLRWLDHHRSALAPARPLTPTAAQLDAVLDKARTLKAAADLGIQCPQTWHPDSADIIPPDVQYPVVLKWSDPIAISPRLEAAGLPMHKAEFASDKAALQRILQRYRPLSTYPMVQTYIRGGGFGHLIFMSQGEPLLRFQHQRLHEWPPEGGASTLCRSLPPDTMPELMGRSIALLRALAWEGPAMVEYRGQLGTDDPMLMEINGRFWGSLPLAVAAGAPFPWLTYAVMGLGETPNIVPYQAGLTACYVIPELKRLARVWFQQDRIQDPLYRARPLSDALRLVKTWLSPKTVYFVWSWQDPRPFLTDGLSIITKAVG